jgi:hypothetical protein
LQIAQIALSVRRAPGGRTVDITSSLVMFIASHVSAEARERASPPEGLKFVSTMRVVQAVRVFRQCDGSAGNTGYGADGEHGNTVLT